MKAENNILGVREMGITPLNEFMGRFMGKPVGFWFTIKKAKIYQLMQKLAAAAGAWSRSNLGKELEKCKLKKNPRFQQRLPEMIE